jgi:hypothetical protein
MSDNQVKTAAEAAEAAALQHNYSVRLNSDGQMEKQYQPIPKSVAKKRRADKSPAEWAYERIVMYIQQFETTLDAEHEVGMGFAGSEAGSVKIQGMGFFAPDMVTFYGEDGEGSKMQLVQHVNQLNVMLVAERKSVEQAEPNRIGFQLAEDLEKEDTPDVP